MSAPRDLDSILDTLREVQASLDRRVARAEGALLMVWGLVGAAIFAFYQLVHWNHAPYEAALGPFLPWIWTAPIALGYVLSGVIGARLGQARPHGTRHGLLASAIPGLLATLLASLLVLTQRYEYTYGGITALVGATTIAFALANPPTPLRPWSLASGGGMVAAGAALMIWTGPWAGAYAALAFLVGLVGLGTVRYRSGA